jgi:hypothetical protein
VTMISLPAETRFKKWSEFALISVTLRFISPTIVCATLAIPKL